MYVKLQCKCHPCGVEFCRHYLHNCFSLFYSVFRGTRNKTYLPSSALPAVDRSGGAQFYYCTYVLHISRYSGFLWVVTTNTGIFLCGLKLRRESRTWQVLLVSKINLGVTMHFSVIIKIQFGKKRHTLLCILLFLE